MALLCFLLKVERGHRERVGKTFRWAALHFSLCLSLPCPLILHPFSFIFIRTSTGPRFSPLMVKSDTFIHNWAPLEAYLSLCSCTHASARFKTTFSSWVMSSYLSWSRGQHSPRPAFHLYPSIIHTQMASGIYKHDSSTYINTYMKYTLNKRLLNIILLRGTRIWAQMNNLNKNE